MRKRRSLLDSASKSAQKRRQLADEEPEVDIEGVTTARGRLQGALQDALEFESDGDSNEQNSTKRGKYRKKDQNEAKIDDIDEQDDGPQITKTDRKQSYVLKLFDRSVDLWQFDEQTPLYPICRAWMLNKPKVNYDEVHVQLKDDIGSIELPGPEGEPISRIPSLLPVQEARNKDNINLNYDNNLPSREQLLQSHVLRWNAIRQAWQEQNHLFEKRYSATQGVLNKIHNNGSE